MSLGGRLQRLRTLVAAHGRVVGVFTFLLVFPHLPFVPFSVVGVAIQAAQLAIVSASLVLLTGWVGQISLGHAALVGIGAYATGWATAAWGLPFPFNTLVAGVAAAVTATLLGAVALRVRGLYLAVSTLIFSWMADAFLFRIGTVVEHSVIDAVVIGDQQGVPRFDLGDRTTMYYVAWGVALSVLFVAANVRDSKTGRALFAVRGSEIGAASLGIDVTRYKLIAFTFSGFLVGVAGSLIMIDARALSPEQFQFTVSFFYLAVAVVGGLVSLGGAVASAVLFSGLNEVFFRVRALGDALDLVSALLLAVVLLLYRGGLAAVPSSITRAVDRLRAFVQERQPHVLVVARRRVGAGIANVGGGALEAGRAATADISRLFLRVRFVDADAAVAAPELRRPLLVNDDDVPLPAPVAREAEPGGAGDPVVEVVASDERAAPPTAYQVALPPRAERPLLVEAVGVTVRFGGLVAVRDASLEVREHEIVGLIGPNGAGKTTLFNAIAGLNKPASGELRLFGKRVDGLPVHKRAHLGVARTFQAIQLFPELDVKTNLLVATHVHNKTGFFSNAFSVDSSVRAERGARERVAEVLGEFRLEDVADRPVADLPFGVLRIVELARAMVTGFPLIMLDEPASGLDNNETDRLAETLLAIRARGVTMLLIEHDVRMVTAVSDFMYVLSRGEIIATGEPAEVQRHPAVIEAYLGEPATEPSVPVAVATER